MQIGGWRCYRFNAACLVLKIPIAALCCIAREIVRGRDICFGELRQAANKGFAHLACGEIATVDQQVTISIECPGPALYLSRGRIHVVMVQHGISNPDRAVAAMGNNMNCIHAAIGLQRLRDLRDAVALVVQYDHINAPTVVALAAQVIHQRVVIRGARVNEYQFQAFVVTVRRSGGLVDSVQVLVHQDIRDSLVGERNVRRKNTGRIS